MRYLVCYDVADDRRRDRLAQVLLDYGTRVQESVFECLIESKLAEEMLDRANRNIEPLSDKVLVFALCETCDRRTVALGIAQRAAEAEFYII